MSSVRLLTDAESAVFAGVSLETIREYQRIGLLRAAKREGGLLFTEDQLRAVFQIPDSRTAPTGLQEAAKETSSRTNETRVSAPPQESRTAGETSEAVRETPPVSEPNSALHSQSEPLEARSSTVTYTHPGAHNSYDLLEVNRTLREQIEILREERSWLRKRVEVLETRTERDQMLLLSESKTVSHLIATSRPRSWLFSLPWFRSEQK